MRLSLLILFIFISSVFAVAGHSDTLDLSGSWNYRLVGAPSSVPGEGEISLPNTLDAAHKGVYTPESDNTAQLRREFSFVGEAVYSRPIEIPRDWQGKNIYLKLERTRPSRIIIDGNTVAVNSRVSSPQLIDLTDYFSSLSDRNNNTHRIEIAVNNADSVPPIVARSSHAFSEATQTNWNGILGDIRLIAKNPFHVTNVKISEVFDRHNLEADINLQFSTPAPTPGRVKVFMDGSLITSAKIREGEKTAYVKIPLQETELWSASSPKLHELKFVVESNDGGSIDTYGLTTGFRKFATSGSYFTINGNPVFLRGTVNAAVFPLTGYAPTDIESWMRYFSILKDYGINHVRFHSWTPPEAAFAAADRLGFYLLVELPIWGELDRDLKFHDRFLREDLEGIMEAYAYHPSFVMFSTGNELWGDISLMSEYMHEAKRLNPRILATQGSNLYLGMNGQIGDEDFLIISKNGDDPENAVRGSLSFADSSSGGILNSTYPNSSSNFGEVINPSFSNRSNNNNNPITVPVISHEVGQYQSYPDFTEIEKYTGNLKPDNLREFRQRAQEAGTLRKSIDYLDASGKWAARLYKAEMEMAQRSPGIAGFQLFGLQDYPGQGTALVGILNPFMESKGFVSPQDWRASADDVAILAEFPKFTFFEGETVDIPVLTVNFTQNPDTLSLVSWSTDFSSGSLETVPGVGVIENEAITLSMPKVDTPRKMTLTLKAPDGKTANRYDFHVYPKKFREVDNVTVTSNLTEALILLQQGERVILCPDSATIAAASIDPLFTTDFWNYRMFRTICDEMHLTPSPGTLGLLIDNNHPSLALFPTDSHTDWQWFEIIKNSRPLIIDRLPKDVDPIVEVIDNVERNFRLALLLECNVGKGKLMILPADLDGLLGSTGEKKNPDGDLVKESGARPEALWFLQSLKEYVGSKEFKPLLSLTPEQVVNLLTKPSTGRQIKQLKNETYRRF